METNYSPTSITPGSKSYSYSTEFIGAYMLKGNTNQKEKFERKLKLKAPNFFGDAPGRLDFILPRVLDHPLLLDGGASLGIIVLQLQFDQLILEVPYL